MLPDERTVKEHLIAGSAELKQIAAIDEDEFEKWRTNFQEKEKQGQISTHSDFKLKQVFFPLEDGDYRLITLLPCSLLIWEVTYRINAREWEVKEDNGNEKANAPISFIDNWKRNYGGDRPQNVSHLNSKVGARILPCLPPTFEQDYRLPKRNFFNQLKVYIPRNPRDTHKGIIQLFQSLYNNLLYDPNSLWARKKKRGILQSIIERGIIMHAENIRENAPAGWSKEEKYSSLPTSQKVWLDPYASTDFELVASQEDWQEEIAAQISRYIRSTFEKMIASDPQKRKIILDDALLREISGLAKEYLDG